VIEAGATTLEPAAPAQPSRVWRVVLIVVAAQLAIIALGMVFFTMVGLGNDMTGTCGGG
jgi:hypothetical protein